MQNARLWSALVSGHYKNSNLADGELNKEFQLPSHIMKLLVKLLYSILFATFGSTTKTTSIKDTNCDFPKSSLKYHNYDELTQEMQDLAAKYSNLLTLSHLDDLSVEHRKLWVMKISTDNNGQRSDLKPMVKYVANMHGNEVVGREMLLKFIEYLMITYQCGNVSFD